MGAIMKTQIKRKNTKGKKKISSTRGKQKYEKSKIEKSIIKFHFPTNQKEILSKFDPANLDVQVGATPPVPTSYEIFQITISAIAGFINWSVKDMEITDNLEKDYHLRRPQDFNNLATKLTQAFQATKFGCPKAFDPNKVSAPTTTIVDDVVKIAYAVFA
jgi:hypothetical protein